MTTGATNTKAYPLAWPAGRERTKQRAASKFGERTTAVAFRALKDELGRLGAGYPVVSTNIPLKANGEPYSDPGRMPDPGVAVYFQLRGKPYCLPCDRWVTVEENLYAVAKHIEALRGMERWGVGTVEQGFAGFKQLPPARDHWGILGLAADSSEARIQERWRELAQARHPDVPGGSHAAMAELNAARADALGELERQS